jgi:hypothetical protein
VAGQGTGTIPFKHIGTVVCENEVVPQTGKAEAGVCPNWLQTWACKVLCNKNRVKTIVQTLIFISFNLMGTIGYKLDFITNNADRS